MAFTGPHGLSEDLPSPRRGFAKYAKCRGVHRGGPIIRVSTLALRATAPTPKTAPTDG
ncbi:MAG: hypothetical protein ACO2PN_19435 [Pyrobaculum sp.]